jgi:hypothetical protein
MRKRLAALGVTLLLMLAVALPVAAQPAVVEIFSVQVAR